MNNRCISGLSLAELKLLNELSQRYDLLAAISHENGQDLASNPGNTHGISERLVKHRLEVFYGLVKS